MLTGHSSTVKWQTSAARRPTARRVPVYALRLIWSAPTRRGILAAMSDGEAPEPGAESAPSESTRPQSSTQPTRRQFLGGLTTGAVASASLAQAGCAPAVPVLKTRGATPSTTVCPFCGVGCGCDSGSWLLGRPASESGTLFQDDGGYE
jgi:hypothetical protein